MNNEKHRLFLFHSNSRGGPYGIRALRNRGILQSSTNGNFVVMLLIRAEFKMKNRIWKKLGIPTAMTLRYIESK